MQNILISLISSILVCYIIWVLFSLGMFQRLPLLFSNLSVTKLLYKAANRNGDRIVFKLDAPLDWEVPAIHCSQGESTCWTGRQILKTIERLAAIFQHSLGININDRIAIYKSNDFDILIFSNASIMAGAIGCPINGNLSSDKIGPYLSYLDAKILISDSETAERVVKDAGDFGEIETIVLVDRPSSFALNNLRLLLTQKIVLLHDLIRQKHDKHNPANRGPEDPILIVHTSGTTGFPKGVIITNKGMCQAIRSTLAFNLVSARDRAIFALPFNHQISHLYFCSILLLGVQTHWAADFSPHKTLEHIVTHGSTVFFGFPITYTQLSGANPQQYDLSSIRIWGTTADACHEVHKRSFVKLGSFFTRLGIWKQGSLFIDGLGSSEVGIAALLHITTPWTTKYGRRIGLPVPFGPRVRIINGSGREVRKGEVGRLFIKGRSMFGGYWNVHGKLYEDTRNGWWCTGDMLRKEQDGSLVHLDREVDVIHTQKGDVYSLLIEEKLHSHPAIFDCCVFGVMEDAGFESAAAIVAINSECPEITEQQLLLELNSTLPRDENLTFLRIREWADFPIGITGKTLKRTLRDQYSNQCNPMLSYRRLKQAQS